MASKNPSIDLDIYTQLNTSLPSFDGLTQSDINNHPNADVDLDVYRQLNDSITSFEGFTQISPTIIVTLTIKLYQTYPLIESTN